MKRTLFIVLAIFWLFPVFVSAEQMKHPEAADEIRALMKDSKLTAPTADMAPMAKFSIKVKDIGDRVHVTILNPAMASMKKKVKSAVRIKLASGILHAAGKRNFYFADIVVKKGRAEFSLPNYAKGVKEPVVEHIWGYAESADNDVGFFLLDPKNKWIIYEMDLGAVVMDTLAIGLVMYPNKPTIPLKSLGLGKLKQGRHPELAE